jgi:pyridoxamine 5'-phosphate oxidase
MDPINETLKNIRTDYDSGTLDVTDADPDPVMQFASWLKIAFNSKVAEPNAMNLATVSNSGKPSSRIVLLRNFDHDGFVFFTNYKSRKAADITQSHQVALSFFWPEIHKQVRIEGFASKIPNQESDLYFASRPRESQVGAWASHQSEPVKSRAELDKIVENLTAEFSGRDIPRPAEWGGYAVKPEYFEFWQGRVNRLHDRLKYEKNDSGKWIITRLFP